MRSVEHRSVSLLCRLGVLRKELLGLASCVVVVVVVAVIAVVAVFVDAVVLVEIFVRVGHHTEASLSFQNCVWSIFGLEAEMRRRKQKTQMNQTKKGKTYVFDQNADRFFFCIGKRQDKGKESKTKSKNQRATNKSNKPIPPLVAVRWITTTPPPSWEGDWWRLCHRLPFSNQKNSFVVAKQIRDRVDGVFVEEKYGFLRQKYPDEFRFPSSKNRVFWWSLWEKPQRGVFSKNGGWWFL